MKKTLEKSIQLTSREILTLESKCFPLLSTGAKRKVFLR